MPSSGYTVITFVAGEQPTTAKWNLIGSNDASFNNGNGFEDNIILNRHLSNGIVTPDKLDLDPAYHFIVADESIPTPNFGDMTTIGPTVTVNIGANGMALVLLNAGMYGNTLSKEISYAVSGASTVAASADKSIRFDANTDAPKYAGAFLQTGLTPGSNTFTMKYRSAGVSGRSYQRSIAVIPL